MNTTHDKIMNRILFIKGDIVEQENYDALVCCTNYMLYNDANKEDVDYRVHQAAGKELYRACTDIRGCAMGEVKVTKPFNLEHKGYKCIIHTVGPSGYKHSRMDARNILENCYINCLNKARKKNCRSIIFPCISIGHKGYSFGEQMKIAIRTIYSWLEDNLDYEIRVAICSRNWKNQELFNSVYNEYKNAGVNLYHKDKGIALVLEGGGGKGAFHMGVWKVLKEKGFTEQIRGISGTSIGAINTYLFLSDLSLSEQEDIWMNAEQRYLTNIQQSQIYLRKVIDSIKLRENVTDELDIYSTVAKKEGIKYDRKYQSWRGLNKKRIVDLILGSAAIPVVYKKVTLENGDTVVDGGVPSLKQFRGNKENSNIPIQPLYDLGYRKFVVVYSGRRKHYTNQINDEIKRYGDAQFCRIFPNHSLGKMQELNTEKTNERIRIGEESALAEIKDLAKSKERICFDDLNIWEPLYK